MTRPGLGRRVEFDERSRQYPIRALAGDHAPYTRRWWIPSRAPVLDQGAEGACVGFGVTNELRCEPIPALNLDARYARESIYWPAQQIDSWPGGDYPGADPITEGGTSVLAGVKVAAAAGWYREYRWAFGEEDLARAISHVGPAILGLPWYEGMFDPDRDGYLNPGGAVAGGHCVLAIGINTRRDQGRGAYVIYNSWGPDWGDRGRAWITRAAMAVLLAQDGEACIPTVRSRPARVDHA